MEKEMRNIQQALDIAIRDSKNEEILSGYEVDGRRYSNYLSNSAWCEFKEAMRKTPFYNQYNRGAGGELEEKRGRWGLYPPKMACFGSSSRVTYVYLKDVPNICFEEQLDTIVGGRANLDAALHKEGCDIFIEAKCREIYSNHKGSKAYMAVYNAIGSNFKCDANTLQFTFDKHEINHLDIKQLICHFLAISAGILKGEVKPNIHFVYFIFNPEHIKGYIDKKYREKILGIYKDTLAEIKLFGEMKWLFDAVFDFQSKKLNKEKPDYNFRFAVAEQYGIKDLLIK